MKSKKIISFIIATVLIITMTPTNIAFANTEASIGYQPLSLGSCHSAVIKEYGSLWMWGENRLGELGNAVQTLTKTPIKLMDDVKYISLTNCASAAIKKDGSLWTWGDDGGGRLGNGDDRNTNVPIKIMDDVIEVSLSWNHGAAIKENGSLWMWGNNDYGQLGNNTKTSSDKPIKIMDDVKHISLGPMNCAVLKKDNTLWTWGKNDKFQLGNGKNETNYTPTKIMDDVIDVYIEETHGAAIKKDGSLWMWGNNDYGQLGDNTNEDRAFPIKVMENVKMISLGQSHSMALKEDGSLWVWGDNSSGELGTGVRFNGSNTPIHLMDDVVYMSASWINSAIVKTNGSLWMWGDNGWGQIGDGSDEDKLSPLKIIDNVMMPENIGVIIPDIQEPIKNTPALSDNTAQTMTLNDEIILTVWIDGIYSEVSENDFFVKSSNENIVKIINYDADCGGISDIYDETDVTYLTSVDTSIKGVNPGTASLVYYYQGNEIGRIAVTVEANIAATISDETILKATVLHNNNAFHYYKDTAISPSALINNQIKEGYTKGFANAYLLVDDLLSVLTLNFENGEDLNTSKYYETILADILETDSEGVWGTAYENWGKAYDGYSNKIVQKVAGAVVDSKKANTLDFIKNNKEKKIIETIIDYSDEQGVLKDVTIEVDILDKLTVTADLIDNFFEATDELYAYSAVQQEKIDVLQNICSNTKNTSLKTACTNLIEDIKFAQKNAVLYYVENFGKSTAYDLFEFSSGIVTGLVLQYITTDTAGVNPYIPGLKEALAIIKTGRLISNTIVNADAISKNILSISAYSEIENEIKNYTTQAENAFVSNSSLDNARNLIAHADFMKATLLHSYDIFVKYVEDVKSSSKNLTIVGNILSILSGDLTAYADAIKGVDSSYDDLIKSANIQKKWLSDEDFYSTDFLDVAQYISVIETTTPSEWAKEYVDLAINAYYIVPDYLQGNYQNNITRAEFCTLLANTLEFYTGKGIQQLVEQSPYTTKLFKDTYYSYVYYMACLGIVNGVSEIEFNPLGEITREEAATMLMRAARVVGCNISAPQTNLQGVSNWATDGVNFVVDRGIMTGTDVGFEPQGKYTKEQAITTFVRFIENLK